MVSIIVNDKTVLFDEAPTSVTTPGQSKHGFNDTEWILCIP